MRNFMNVCILRSTNSFYFFNTHPKKDKLCQDGILCKNKSKQQKTEEKKQKKKETEEKSFNNTTHKKQLENYNEIL